MKIDVNAFKFNRYNIIYGLTAEERSSMTEEILASHPQYKLRTDDGFGEIKFGPFKMKNKRTVQDIMMKNKAVKEKGESYVLRQMKYLECDHYYERRGRSLSGRQRETITLIIDVIDGKKEFLFSDENVKAEHRFVDYAAWLNTQGFMLDKGYKAVWLSMLSADEVVELIKEKAPDTRTYWDFYSIKNGEIIFEDNLFARKEKEKYIRQEEAKARRKDFDIAAENKNYSEIYRLGIEIDADEYATVEDKLQAYISLGELYGYGLDRDIDIKTASAWYIKGINLTGELDGEADDELYEESYTKRIMSGFVKINNILKLNDYEGKLAQIIKTLKAENPDMSEKDINLRARITLGEMADREQYKLFADSFKNLR
ncbi:MAG: hypothetical protein IJN37_07640 [Clostridia bacterium]|nr:hypothetical protein [Clostridia bacterium]